MRFFDFLSSRICCCFKRRKPFVVVENSNYQDENKFTIEELKRGYTYVLL